MAETTNAPGGWLQRYAPDVSATVRRFPLAIGLAAVATAVALFEINGPQLYPEDLLMRPFFGLAIGAILAVAGVLFREGRPQAKMAGIVFAWLLPLAVGLLCQVPNINVVGMPLPLLAAAMLWLSVSAFTVVSRGEAREEQQNRFWWLNHRAVATAGLAAFGFIVILLGVMAIERSLHFLFGIEIGDIFYRWVMPVVGLFLSPLYWLATLPCLEDYNPREMDSPDFTAGAIGFLGQFVLAPFLAIYAVILLAYAGQIVLVGQLPQGTIGWMVLAFVVTGAATWLLLHPPFMRRKPIVSLFRRFWFWLTLIPLALFFVAVAIRLDAYGLTTERLVLVSGGIWAALLTLAYLFRLGDVRLIPALAGAILLVFSIGPWNYFAGPDHDQAARLGRLLALVKDPTATASPPDWTAEQAAQARSAMDYLNNSRDGRQLMVATLLSHGHVYDVAAVYPGQVMSDFGYKAAPTDPASTPIAFLPRALSAPVDVSATPYYIGHHEAWNGMGQDRMPGFYLTLVGPNLEVHDGGEVLVALDLMDWAARQGSETLAEPWIDFAIGEVNYRYVLTSASIRREADGVGGAGEVTALAGILFTDDAASTIARL